MEDKGGQQTENDETLHDEDNNDNSENVAQTVGHNMYILAYQVLLLLTRLVFPSEISMNLIYLSFFMWYIKWKSILR